MVVCGVCGKKMRAITGGNDKYRGRAYQCDKPIAHGCGSNAVKAARRDGKPDDTEGVEEIVVTFPRVAVDDRLPVAGAEHLTVEFAQSGDAPGAEQLRQAVRTPPPGDGNAFPRASGTRGGHTTLVPIDHDRVQRRPAQDACGRLSD